MRPVLAIGVLLCASAAQALPERLVFDDFSQRDTSALRAAGWVLRQESGHPGVPAATWSPAAVSLVDDPGRPGNRLLRLSASTDGTPAGTVQAQPCHQRKLLNGTSAARVRFSDAPAEGADGDPIIQTFYAVAPLRFDFDPSSAKSTGSNCPPAAGAARPRGSTALPGRRCAWNPGTPTTRQRKRRAAVMAGTRW